MSKKFFACQNRYLVSSFILLFLPYFNMCNSPKDIRNNTTTEMWYDKLPPCPCESPDKNGIKLNDGWAKDKGDLHKYHRGASESFRSYPYIKTSEGNSGQQCCYDSTGKLITGGSGAGTPDKESTCDGEDSKGVMTTRMMGLIGHYTKDVKPWEDLGGADSGWVKYNELWKPDNKNNCPQNIVFPK